MGWFSISSEISRRVKGMQPGAIRALPSAEKARLAEKVVEAKKVPGRAEQEALVHLFANLEPDDYLTPFDRRALGILKSQMDADQELKRGGVEGEWSSICDQERIRILTRVVGYHAASFHFPPGFTVFFDFPGMSAFGAYDTGTGKVNVDTRSEAGHSRLDAFEKAVITPLHEHTHRYQDTKLIPMWENGSVPEERAAQARLMRANKKCYFPRHVWGPKVYEAQPLERHAFAVADEAYSPILRAIDAKADEVYREFLRRQRQKNKTLGMIECTRSRFARAVV